MRNYFADQLIKFEEKHYKKNNNKTGKRKKYKINKNKNLLHAFINLLSMLIE